MFDSATGCQSQVLRFFWFKKNKFHQVIPPSISVRSPQNSSPLKMDGWNISFLLGWPLFRGELLVSGSVYNLIRLDDTTKLLAGHPKSPSWKEIFRSSPVINWGRDVSFGSVSTIVGLLRGGPRGGGSLIFPNVSWGSPIFPRNPIILPQKHNPWNIAGSEKDSFLLWSGIFWDELPTHRNCTTYWNITHTPVELHSLKLT